MADFVKRIADDCAGVYSLESLRHYAPQLKDNTMNRLALQGDFPYTDKNLFMVFLASELHQDDFVDYIPIPQLQQDIRLLDTNLKKAQSFNLEVERREGRWLQKAEKRKVAIQELSRALVGKKRKELRDEYAQERSKTVELKRRLKTAKEKYDTLQNPQDPDTLAIEEYLHAKRLSAVEHNKRVVLGYDVFNFFNDVFETEDCVSSDEEQKQLRPKQEAQEAQEEKTSPSEDADSSGDFSGEEEDDNPSDLDFEAFSDTPVKKHHRYGLRKTRTQSRRFPLEEKKGEKVPESLAIPDHAPEFERPSFFQCPKCKGGLEIDLVDVTKACTRFTHEEAVGGCGWSFCICCGFVDKDEHEVYRHIGDKNNDCVMSYCAGLDGDCGACKISNCHEIRLEDHAAMVPLD